jgi:exonuclease III
MDTNKIQHFAAYKKYTSTTKHYFRIRGVKKFFQSNGPRKQAGVAIIISNKIDFQSKLIKHDKKGHFIFIRGKIHQKKVSILNIYAPNARVPNL